MEEDSVPIYKSKTSQLTDKPGVLEAPHPKLLVEEKYPQATKTMPFKTVKWKWLRHSITLEE
jgi:hypothetical protein